MKDCSVQVASTAAPNQKRNMGKGQMQNSAVLNQGPVKILANPPEVEGQGGMGQDPHGASERMPPSQHHGSIQTLGDMFLMF